MVSEKLKKILNDFIIDRNWNKYHTEENLAKAISVESGELLKNYLWDESFRKRCDEIIIDEIADILIYIYYLCELKNLDTEKIILNKIAKNKIKYT